MKDVALMVGLFSLLGIGLFAIFGGTCYLISKIEDWLQTYKGD